MEVLHLDSGREMRGGQWQALYLMVGQKTIGLKPKLLARRGSPIWREAEKRGVECGRLSLWNLWRESAHHKLVHAHDARSHTMAVVVSRCPVIVSRRVAFPISGSRLSRWKYARAARYLAISEYVAGLLAESGVPPDKVAVVYDGVPIDPKAPLGSALLSPSWGGDPRKPRALAEKAASLAGVPLQFAADLKADLLNAQALLYVSEMEGLGSGALLAMSAGVPVIASRVGGLPEIVHDMVNGLVVDNEPNSLADAIRRLMTDRPLAERLGMNGREMVKEHFTLAHMALRTLHEYKKVLA